LTIASARWVFRSNAAPTDALDPAGTIVSFQRNDRNPRRTIARGWPARNGNRGPDLGAPRADAEIQGRPFNTLAADPGLRADAGQFLPSVALHPGYSPTILIKDSRRTGKFRPACGFIHAIAQSNDVAMNKSESVSLRVTKDVKKAVERAARSAQLTTAAFVERVLIDGLQQRGYLRPASSPAPAEDTKSRGQTIT
jgi:hypothetical protein